MSTTLPGARGEPVQREHALARRVLPLLTALEPHLRLLESPDA